MLTNEGGDPDVEVLDDAVEPVSSTPLNDTSASNDWRTEMAIGRPNDPMRTAPAPLVSDEPDQRVVSMTWEHDWLGNMQSWDDDSAVFYERSLGEIVNGADLPSEAPSRRTGALYVASNLPSTAVTADDGGWVEVRYGEDVNALAVTVHGRCGDPDENEIPLDCRSGGGLGGLGGFGDEEEGGDTDDPEEAVDLSCAYSCATEQHFTYAWDEVNRIAHARRLDREDGGDWELAVEQRYLYDANNQRMVKTTTFRGLESGTERSALYVYPGDFERRGLERSSEFSTFGPGRYEAVAGDTETQYGVGGARIVWRTSDRDETLDRDQRITLSLTDLIQSTTAVIDLATGELVEAGSFYANGARETYRSNETETVTPEPMGFTGKEADEEVGLTYFGHRYLMAHLGRWASPDPLQTHAVGGGEAINGYHYVAGSTLQSRDPEGLDLESSDVVLEDPAGRNSSHPVGGDAQSQAQLEAIHAEVRPDEVGYFERQGLAIVQTEAGLAAWAAHVVDPEAAGLSAAAADWLEIINSNIVYETHVIVDAPEWVYTNTRATHGPGVNLVFPDGGRTLHAHGGGEVGQTWNRDSVARAIADRLVPLGFDGDRVFESGRSGSDRINVTVSFNESRNSLTREEGVVTSAHETRGHALLAERGMPFPVHLPAPHGNAFNQAYGEIQREARAAARRRERLLRGGQP